MVLVRPYVALWVAISVVAFRMNEQRIGIAMNLWEKREMLVECVYIDPTSGSSTLIFPQSWKHNHHLTHIPIFKLLKSTIERVEEQALLDRPGSQPHVYGRSSC